MKIYLKLTYSKAVADLEGFLWFRRKSPLRFQEAPRNLVEYTLKLNISKIVPRPFCSRSMSVPGIQAQCVRLGVLLEAKLTCSALKCWQKLVFSLSLSLSLFNQLWAKLFVKPETSFSKS